jgi:GNAT superfamily N-acetyltransferase
MCATQDFVLRPLRTSHVELDYDAVMEDPSYLRTWSQSGWPADEFTLGENLKDLERHEREHDETLAFTFTILSIGGERCLGCVYITPFGMRIAADEIPTAYLPKPDAFAADVCFWVRPSLQRDDLESKLLHTLRKWLRSDWPFDTIFLHTSEADRRQQEICDQAGLDPIAHFQSDHPRPGKWVLYEIS